MTRWVVLDTETTGLDPRQGHRVVEIGLVEIIKRRPGRSWHRYLNPGRDSDAGALQKHGLTSEFLRDKPDFSQVVESFLEFLTAPPLASLIIHNAPFDTGFLDHELARLGLPPLLQHLPDDVLVDSLLLARTHFPGKRNSLDALCDRFGVDNSGRTFHGALLDAQLLGDVYLAMTRGQETLFIPETSFHQDHVVQRRGAGHPQFPLRVVLPNEEEIQRHEAQMKAIHQLSAGQAIWSVAFPDEATDQP